MPQPSLRADADACPGALRLHSAADGPLARIRVPGGRLTGAQVDVVRELAQRWGDGHAELTSRANLQLRALKDTPAAHLEAGLRAAGLLPSTTHELVRNIAASPIGGQAAQIRAFDEALCADPRLASLPGRFLFALDSGAGDVAFSADVAALPLDSGAGSVLGADGFPGTDHLSGADSPPGADRLPSADRLPGADFLPAVRLSDVDALPGAGGGSAGAVAILFAGVDAGLRVPSAVVIPALIAAAHAFLDERAAQQARETPPAAGSSSSSSALAEAPPDRDAGASGEATPTRPSSSTPAPRPVAWRVRELVDGPARVAQRTAAALGIPLGQPGPLRRPSPREPIGIVEQSDGRVSLGALVPLGRLNSVQMKVLASAATVVVTPWRGILLPDLAAEAAREWAARLAGVGLEVAAGSRWVGVTACAGRPGCAKSLADVRHDAEAVTVAGQGLPVHWVGCARGCGSPAGPHVRVEATGSGYEVRSPGGCEFAPVAEVGALVGAVRKG